MADDIRRIRGFLAGLVLRERALLAVRLAGRLVLVWALSFAWFSLVPHLQLERAVGLLLLVVGTGIGTWFAVAMPLLREWPETGDPLRQAARVEALRPELRGRLVTAVDGTRGPVEPSREALLSLVVGRALRGIQGVRSSQVHQARRVVPAVALGAAASLVGGALFLGLGPRTAVSWWFRGSNALAAAIVAPDGAGGDIVGVGDLVLTYTFPDYTGLEPKVVSNGTGEVEAPPGTVVRVEARSADTAEAAGLVAYDENLEATLGEDGRALSGRFTVRDTSGVWRFALYRGGVADNSRDFAIEPSKDLPPEVTLSVGDGVDRVEIAVDRSFGFEWQARDDFGISSVALAIDGKDRVPLDRPDRRRADLAGSKILTPRDLGLSPGDRAMMVVAAYDNDTVSGSKRGESRPVQIIVLGANGRDDQIQQRREDLLEAMIPILADNLVDPWPPGDSAGEVASWGEQFAGRYRPLTELTESLWAGMTTKGADRKVVEHVLDTARDLVRFTQTAFEPGSPERAGTESVKLAAGMRDSAIVALEDAILALNRSLEMRALGEVAKVAEELADAAARLEQTLASENPDVQELLSQLDQLERMMAQMAKESARLGDSGLKEFVNSRQSEIRNLQDEIRKAIAEGRLDDARKMMERLSRMLRELSEGVADQLSRKGQEAQDTEDAAAKLQEELEALEKEQRALQSEVSQLREQDQNADAAARVWEELVRKSTAHQRDADAFAGGLATAGRPFYERERAAMGTEAANDLQSAVEARDVRGARNGVANGERSWQIERRAYELEAGRRDGRLPGPGAAELDRLQAELDEISALLDQLDRAESQMSPEARERAQSLEERQRGLEQRTQEALESGRSLERKLPVRPQGMEQALEDAQKRMDQASQDLGEGQPMQAEGSQGMAAERLKEAAEALQEAREQAAQQAREMQQGQGGEPGSGQGGDEEGEGQGPEEEGGRSHRGEDLEIPGRESFQTPEEYRRALLEGMEGEVPEEYRAMKKRYFEELVSQ